MNTKLQRLLKAEHDRLADRGVWFGAPRMADHCEFRPEFLDFSKNEIRETYKDLLVKIDHTDE